MTADRNHTADALTEVADYHVTECVDMHGDQGEDGPGPDCCFHARAAYTVGDAARLLRTPDTPTDSDAAARARALLNGPKPTTHAGWQNYEDEMIAAAPTLITDLLAEVDRLHSLTEGDPYSIYHEAAEMRSELMHLRRWKLEATEVIESWERVYEALGDVGGLGQLRSDAVLAEVLRLKAELDRAQLRSIEARNPGIDMDEVRMMRTCECVHRGVQHDHIGCAVIGCDCPATNPRSTDG